MLPRHHRLRNSSDFSAVLRRGQGRRRSSDPLLVVVLKTTDSDDPTPPRVGFVVSKAVGNSVIRHRVVRRLRALVSARLSELPAGADVVVRALPPAAMASSPALATALDRCLAMTLTSAGSR